MPQTLEQKLLHYCWTWIRLGMIFIPLSILTLIILNFNEFFWSQPTTITNLANRPQTDLIKEYKKLISLSSFENTLQAFPYLRKNMKATVMAQIFEQGECFNSFYHIESTRYAILDNKVYIMSNVNNSDFPRWRIDKYKQFLDSVLAKMEIPDMYFIVNVEDQIKQWFVKPEIQPVCRSLPLFMFNKNSSLEFEASKFLLPDIFMVNRWDHTLWETRLGSKVHRKFSEKVPKMFFRGAPSAPSFYQVWISQQSGGRKEILRYYHRGGFVLLSLQHPDRIDAKFTQDQGRLFDFIEKMVGKDKIIYGPRLSHEEQQNYKYLLAADGYGAAWQRVQSFLSSTSLLVKPYSEIVQWFYDKMIPQEHFVMLKPDLSDILGRWEDLEKNESQCLRIIRNANTLVAEHLTPEEVLKAAGTSLIKFAKIQRLNLTKEEKKLVKDGGNLHTMLIEKRKIELQSMDKLYLRQWSQNSRLASFEGTLDRFPFLKDNIRLSNMLTLLMEGNCGKNLHSFLILDGEVYLQGVSNSFAEKFKDLLTIKSKQINLKDMFFLVQFASDPDEPQPFCHQLPTFSMDKNISSELEQTRFLLPSLEAIDKSWAETIEGVKKQSQESKWQNKTLKAYFFGQAEASSSFSASINGDTDLYRYHHGAGFVLLSDQRPDLINAKFSTPSQSPTPLLKEVQRRLRGKKITAENSSESLNLTYKYQLVSNGPSRSTQRTAQLLFSNSLILKPFSSRMQWFDDKLIPGVHFVPLAEDLSDCLSKIVKMKGNDTEAKEIVRRANEFAQKELGPKAVEKYLLDTLEKYAAIQKLNISQRVKTLIKNGTPFRTVLEQSKI